MHINRALATGSPTNESRVKEKFMERWICTICQYVYDPEAGDPDNNVHPGTTFEDIPDDWVCPLCGAGKDVFEPA